MDSEMTSYASVVENRNLMDNGIPREFVCDNIYAQCIINNKS